MATKLVELKDGTLVEVEVIGEQVESISGSIADKVETTLDRIKPILLNACKPITSVWKELSQNTPIEQAEIEIGLSFEGEGNIYITKAKAGANLTIKLILKPQS